MKLSKGAQKVFEENNTQCNCNLQPHHSQWEHDWCCQKCGGYHSERICREE